MEEIGKKSAKSGLIDIGIPKVAKAYWNLSPAELVEQALIRKEGILADNGALMCDTGKFTGRSPKDKFTVLDANTRDVIWWGDINQPFDEAKFEALYAKMIKFLEDKEVFVRDAYAGADPDYRLHLRVVNTLAWHNLFCYNLFLRPSLQELETFEPNFVIINIPDFQADPATDGTRQANFTIINFTKRIILIGGSAYAGEMKKGIFTVLNYILPHEKNVLSMHCSANMGKEGDVAIFFGLSGTGKTTLSADPNRYLIGDDEHGWTEKGIFNFEGGCYAKVVNITRENEPQIWDAIRFGAVLENTRCFPNTRTPDYSNISVTENTRVGYPIHYINNAVEPSVAGIPKNIFFLTADAFGVLPPIARLTPEQAMYFFISGYTAKVAGTEVGVLEPQATFSACFGAAFLPLHPTKYAELLGKKMREHQVKVWLINTGWTGGPYGVGSRMKLKYTRAMLTAAIEGLLDNVPYTNHPIFGIAMPQYCPGVPDKLLNPCDTWTDKELYNLKANELAMAFVKNFEKYADFASEEILSAAPKVASTIV